MKHLRTKISDLKQKEPKEFVKYLLAFTKTTERGRTGRKNLKEVERNLNGKVNSCKTRYP